LLDTSKSEVYGLESLVISLPNGLRQELSEFRRWCTNPIQLDRESRYRCVQEVTHQAMESTMLAYLGFQAKVLRVRVEQLSLFSYRDPQTFARFVGYIIARDVGYKWASRHLSTCKKVLSYLCTLDATWPHTAAMQQWLGSMDKQLPNTIPRAQHQATPPAEAVFEWVDGLVEVVEAMVMDDTSMFGRITTITAQHVHDAVLAMMVTGSYVPPPRLHTLKSACHPDLAVSCTDPDCMLGPQCRGNRFELSVEGGVDVVRYVAPHHKNDRRSGVVSMTITYALPADALTRLMAVHIREGHQLLRALHRKRQPRLFMSNTGLEFADPKLGDLRFDVWWKAFFHGKLGPASLMQRQAGAGAVPYFPPSKGRNIFVEYYMATTGNSHPGDSWEGAANAMGTSVKQWREFYAPTIRQRMAQQAVDGLARVRDTTRDRGGSGAGAGGAGAAGGPGAGGGAGGGGNGGGNGGGRGGAAAAAAAGGGGGHAASESGVQARKQRSEHEARRPAARGGAEGVRHKHRRRVILSDSDEDA
jgi:hypothetical protein